MMKYRNLLVTIAAAAALALFIRSNAKRHESLGLLYDDDIWA